jgi:hypothetical protein
VRNLGLTSARQQAASHRGKTLNRYNDEKEGPDEEEYREKNG